MEQKLEQNKVGVFFDYENIVYSLRNRFEQKANFDALIDKCNELGRVIVARVFADWSLSHMSSALLYSLQSSGFDLIFVPTGSTQSNTPRKNVADLYMAIHVMQTLYEQPDIQTFVLLTGDRDFMPLVNVLKRQGKRVVAIGVDGSSSFYLTQAVDEFFYYSEVEEIFAETPKRSKGRQTNIYDALVQAIQFLEEKGKSTMLAHIKPTMIELMDGFDESNYTDAKGRPFQRFKDFIMEAKRRGIIRLVNSAYGLEVTVADQTSEKPIPMIESADPEPIIIPETGELTAVAAFELLARAVQLAQQEGKSFRASSIKSLIIRLHPGFNESEIENGSVRFGRFSDFVRAAANQKYVEVTGAGAKLEIRPNRTTTPPLPPEPKSEPTPATPNLTEVQVREAVLGALRSYTNYPTSFLALANHCQRWSYNRRVTLEDSAVRLVLTEAVELGLLTQNKRGDGKRQYEFVNQANLIERFLDLAAGGIPLTYKGDLDDLEVNEFEVPQKSEPLDPIKPAENKTENPIKTENRDNKKAKHPIVHPHKRTAQENKQDSKAVQEPIRTEIVVPAAIVPPPSAESQKPAFDPPTYQEYQQLTDQGEREFLVSALRSYGQYPSAFMAILAHCRTLRDAQQLYLPNANLRELLSESSRVGVIYSATNRSERPTLYSFNDDVQLLDLYIRQVTPDDVVTINPASTPVPTPTEEMPIETPATETEVEVTPESIEVEEQAPAVITETVAESIDVIKVETPPTVAIVSEKEAAPASAPVAPVSEPEGIDREANLFVADAISAFEGSAPFTKILAHCTALREEQGIDISTDRIRDALSTAARVGLLEITSRRGVRPTYYGYTGSESALIAYLGKITVPNEEEAETVVEPSAEPFVEQIVEIETPIEPSAEPFVEQIVEVETPIEPSAEPVVEQIVEAETPVEPSAEPVVEQIVEAETPVEPSAEPVVEQIVEAIIEQPAPAKPERLTEPMFDNYFDQQLKPYPVVSAFELIALATQEAARQNASRRVASINARLHKLDPNFVLASVITPTGGTFKKLSELIHAAADAGYIEISGRGIALELIPLSKTKGTESSSQE